MVGPLRTYDNRATVLTERRGSDKGTVPLTPRRLWPKVCDSTFLAIQRSQRNAAICVLELTRLPFTVRKCEGWLSEGQSMYDVPGVDGDSFLNTVWADLRAVNGSYELGCGSAHEVGARATVAS